VERLRGQIALVQRRASDAARLLLNAARGLGPLDAALARETHLEALEAAIWVGDLNDRGGMLEAAEAARAAPAGPEPPRMVDVLLDAFAVRFTDGCAAAAPTLTRALELVRAPNLAEDDVGRWLIHERVVIGLELWDLEAAHILAAHEAQLARDTGAPLYLRLALNLLANTHLLRGELTTTALLIEQDRLIGEATGNPPIAFAEIMLAAWRGQEALASELIKSTVEEATAGGMGRLVDFATYASSVLYNGLGRHDAARDAARRAFQPDHLGYGPLIVPELAEAASRTGDVELVRTALEWLSERTRVTPTEWALGIEARVRALLSEGEAADRLYRESIDRLGRTRVRVELARGRLLYGEWLRRERRRVDAREQLRTAHEMLTTMGIDAFAERARRELLATGETVRKRTVETRDELTAQESQIARLARDGLSNPEIGSRLFISPRTVKYHLRKVFIKLDIRSRNELERALSSDPDALSAL
jgi:ATP/maltotriose-dependent transcriptional regulator MalT